MIKEDGETTVATDLCTAIDPGATGLIIFYILFFGFRQNLPSLFDSTSCCYWRWLVLLPTACV